MKRKLNNYLKIGIFFFGISVLLWNCQQEDLPIEKQIETQLTTLSLSEARQVFSLHERKVNNAIKTSKSFSSSAIIINPDWSTFSQDSLNFTNALLSRVEASINVSVDFDISLVFIGIENHTIKAIQSIQANERYDNG